MTLARCAVMVAALAAAGTVQAGGQSNAPPSLAWQAVRNGPLGGTVTELIETSDHVLLAGADGLLYRSTDDGRTWTPCSRLARRLSSPPQRPMTWVWHTIAQTHAGWPDADGLRRDEMRVTDPRCEAFGFVPVPPGSAAQAWELTFLGPNLIVTRGGVFRSSDGGRTWSLTLSFPVPPGCAAATWRSTVAIAGGSLYRSSDNGTSWTEAPHDPDAARRGASAPGTNPGLRCSLQLSSNYRTLYSYGPGGLWRSTDDGASWSRVFDGVVYTFTATERRLWILTRTDEGITLMRSEDEGASWTSLPFLRESAVGAYRLVDTLNGTLLAATAAGVFRSTDRGESWTRTGTSQWAVSLAADGQRSYASGMSGLWTSLDGGSTWRMVSSTVDGQPWQPRDRLTRVFDTGDGRTRGVVNERRLTWRSSGLDKDVLSLVRVDGVWYAGTSFGVFRSSDLDAWVECSFGLTAGGPLVATDSGDLLVGGSARSTDRCRSWWPFPSESAGQRVGVRFVFNAPGDGVLAVGDGIYHLDLTTREWTKWKNAVEITATSAVQDRLGRYWMGTDRGVYVLTVNGISWDVWPMGLEGERIVSLAVDPTGYLLAAVEGLGLLRARINN